jgi:hypothetical protein
MVGHYTMFRGMKIPIQFYSKVENETSSLVKKFSFSRDFQPAVQNKETAFLYHSTNTIEKNL